MNFRKTKLLCFISQSIGRLSAQGPEVTSTGINSTAIGATAPSTGSFTTLNSSGAATLNSVTTALTVGTSTVTYVSTQWVNADGTASVAMGKNGALSGWDRLLQFNAGPSQFYMTTGELVISPEGTPGVGIFTSTGLALTVPTTATKFSVGSGAGTSFALFYGGFSSGSNGVDITSNDDASDSWVLVFRNASTASIGSVNRVGTTNAVAYNTTSDGRLKTNVRDFIGADSGRIIDGRRPRWFDWKEAKDSSAKNVIGFIAQEENAVDPALARIGAVRVGDDDPSTITHQWAVDPAKLVPVLTAEVKSLRARVATLEAAPDATIGRLTARLDRLERENAALNQKVIDLESR